MQADRAPISAGLLTCMHGQARVHHALVHALKSLNHVWLVATRPGACLTQVPHEAQVLAVQVVAAVRHDDLHAPGEMCLSRNDLQTHDARARWCTDAYLSGRTIKFHGIVYPQCVQPRSSQSALLGCQESSEPTLKQPRLHFCTTGAVSYASAGKPGAAGTCEPCRAKEFTT